jgi:hypothetical protein
MDRVLDPKGQHVLYINLLPNYRNVIKTSTQLGHIYELYRPYDTKIGIISAIIEEYAQILSNDRTLYKNMQEYIG